MLGCDIHLMLIKFANMAVFIVMITKNSLILRDLYILQEMAKYKLVMVYVSITSLDEKLRLKMEARTTTAKQCLKIIGTLSKAGLPIGDVNDSRFGTRMRSKGNFAEIIRETFKLHCKLNQLNNEAITLYSNLFRIPQSQIRLFYGNKKKHKRLGKT